MNPQRPIRTTTRAPRAIAAPFRARLVIMAKVPVAGNVKTRLARQIGTSEAVRFYRATSSAVIGRLARQPFWETIIAVSPDAGAQGCQGRIWPRGIKRAAQGGGDLGNRMQRPMRRLAPGPVCVVGTDVPGITVALVRRAFRLLGNRTIVFGPAADGGFWLVGQRRRTRLVEPYAKVRWSHPETLADVLGNIERGPGGAARVGFTGQLHDVDEVADLVHTRGQFGRRIPPPNTGSEAKC